MASIQIHKVISKLISFYFLIGVWHRGEKHTTKGKIIKIFVCIYHLLFAISLLMGAFANDEMEQSVFLAEVAIGAAILSIRLWLLMWKQKEILDLLNRICVFSIRSDHAFKLFNVNVKGFINFALVFFTAVTFMDGSVSTVLPIAKESTLFFEIAFPMDYRNSELALWMANLFLFTEVILSYIATIFHIVIWYLLLICSLRYDVLGYELKNMGRSSEKGKLKVTERQMQTNFSEDLKSSIDTQLHLKKLTDELGNFFSDLFFIQFGTSGLCICFSIYCLAFGVGTNLLERSIPFLLCFYFISELFMITYFGNEIKLSSNRLSYSLYESDWYNQPQSTKKTIIIFGEYLKQPQEMLVGKLYPLTLETFTRIFKSAYSMFNILKSFQK